MANAATLFIDPITFGQMLERQGFNAKDDFHELDAHWGMTIKATNLPSAGNASVYPATIINTGTEVRLIINKHDLGPITPKTVPDAVKALRAYGGTQAPAYLYATEAGRTDSIYVFKPKGKN